MSATTKTPAAPARAVSPCTNVCTLDSATGLCRGCWRTLDEISAWSRITNDERLGILAAVTERRAGPA